MREATDGDGVVAPSRARTWLLQAGAVVATVAVFAAGAVAIARPWRSDATPDLPPAYDLVVPTGRVARVDVTGPGGARQATISSSFDVLPGLRAATELPRHIVDMLNKQVTGTRRPSNAQARRGFGRVVVLRQWNREVDVDGSQSFTEAIHLVDRRGVHLVGLTDTRSGETVYDPPLRELSADPQVGDRWKQEGIAGSQPYRSTMRVVKRGPATTPTGRWPDCVTLQSNLSRGVVPQDSRTTDVYCVGPGGTSTVVHGDPVQTYRAVAVEGHPGRAPTPVAGRRGANTPPEDSSTWALARVVRLESNGSISQPSFAPEPIATDPPALITATEDRNGIRAVQASGPGVGRRLWSFTTGGPVYGAPRYDPVHGRLFFGASNRKVYALDARGLYLWSFATADNVAARPAIAGDLVVVASEDAKVYGLDAATGRRRWTFDADAASAADPAVVGGTVVVGTDDGTVYGIDVRSGRQRWSHDLGGAVLSPVATAGDDVVVGGAGGQTERLDGRTGRPRWSRSLDTRTSSGPAVGGGAVAVVDDAGELVGRRLADGAGRWVLGDRGYVGTPAATPEGFVVTRASGLVDLVDERGHPVRTWRAQDERDAGDRAPTFERGPRIGGGALYVADQDSVVRRLGPAAEDVVPPIPLSWVRRPDIEPGFLDSALHASAAAWRGRAVMVDPEGNLLAVDPRDGGVELIAAIDHEGNAAFAPVVVGDDAIVPFSGRSATDRGTLVRVSLRTGRVRWSVPMSGVQQQPLVVSGGRVVAVHGDTSAEVVLEARDLRTGRRVWSHPAGGATARGLTFPPPGPVADGSTVYAGTPLTAYDLGDGSVRWTSTAPDPLGGLAMSPDHRTVYASTLTGVGEAAITAVVAVDAATGDPRWLHPLEPGSLVSPTDAVYATPKTVVVPIEGPTAVLGLDAETGKARWDVPLPTSRLGGSALIDGRLWSLLDHGRMLAVDAESGRLAGVNPGLGEDLALDGFFQRPVQVGDTVVVPGGSALLGFGEPEGAA